MRKRLGQHFLCSDNAARLLVESVPVQSGNLVLEIGPGKGALTKHLLATGAVVLAIEKDPALASLLHKTFAAEIGAGDLVLHTADVRDFLRTELPATPYIVAANIPYYLTGRLLRDLLESSRQPSAIALVVQKEVAERLVRRKNSKESILSLSVQFFGTPAYIKTLSKRLFSPTPAVDSAIITITAIHSPPKKVRELFFSVIRTAFQQKRKGVLKKFAGSPAIQDLLVQHGVTEKTRAEDIPFSVWLAVAHSAALFSA